MSYIQRQIQVKIDRILAEDNSILLLGPRQTGKTTLLRRLDAALYISFAQPRVRLRYEKDPGILTAEIEALAETLSDKPLIIIDEVQKVPLIMDAVQDLIDRELGQFILTGSSARKLKRGNDVNLLPGRVISLHMDPLILEEIPKEKRKLNDLLLNGCLPKNILASSDFERQELLDAYVTIYLEEEIRAEALVRNLANFARFLELAASESGYIVNYSKLSRVIGIAHSTIAEYYQILEDCLVAERIEPYTKTRTRRKLSQANKFIMFDLGVRRIAANEGEKLPRKLMGHLFEQWVGLELLRLSRLSDQRMHIRFWSDPNGPEVDWLIQKPDELIPIEVKYTDRPDKNDAKHLNTFLKEYEEASKAYVICQVPRRMKLGDNIYAIPWQEISELI